VAVAADWGRFAHAQSVMASSTGEDHVNQFTRRTPPPL
jgi:hypothetical protein